MWEGCTHNIAAYGGQTKRCPAALKLSSRAVITGHPSMDSCKELKKTGMRLASFPGSLPAHDDVVVQGGGSLGMRLA